VKKLKVVAFNGSPRRDGNTALLINKVLQEIEKEGIETEFIQIGGNQIHGCVACGTCRKLKNKKCVIEDDNVNQYIQKNGFLSSYSYFLEGFSLFVIFS